MQGTAREEALLALALLATTATAAHAARASRPDLIVLWSDPQRAVPEASRRALARETERLFSRWGVALVTSWDDGDRSTTPQVRVVLLDQAQLAHRGRRVLGQTQAKPLKFPAVWILVPNVRDVLESEGGTASPPVLARALSRVAAHEILHALGIGHAPRGLMRRALGIHDLTGPWVEVDEPFRRAVLAAVGRSHLQPSDS